MEVGHFDGRTSSLRAFIAQDATGALLGLFYAVDCKDAKRHGRRASGIEDCSALSRLLANVVKVRRVAADYAADDDDAGRSEAFYDECCGIDQLYSARHGYERDVVGLDASLAQGLGGAVAQGVGDGGIPFRRDDIEGGVALTDHGDSELGAVGVQYC